MRRLAVVASLVATGAATTAHAHAHDLNQDGQPDSVALNGTALEVRVGVVRTQVAVGHGGDIESTGPWIVVRGPSLATIVEWTASGLRVAATSPVGPSADGLYDTTVRVEPSGDRRASTIVRFATRTDAVDCRGTPWAIDRHVWQPPNRRFEAAPVTMSGNQILAAKRHTGDPPYGPYWFTTGAVTSDARANTPSELPRGSILIDGDPDSVWRPRTAAHVTFRASSAKAAVLYVRSSGGGTITVDHGGPGRLVLPRTNTPHYYAAQLSGDSCVSLSIPAGMAILDAWVLSHDEFTDDVLPLLEAVLDGKAGAAAALRARGTRDRTIAIANRLRAETIAHRVHTLVQLIIDDQSPPALAALSEALLAGRVSVEDTELLATKWRTHATGQTAARTLVQNEAGPMFVRELMLPTAVLSADGLALATAWLGTGPMALRLAATRVWQGQSAEVRQRAWPLLATSEARADMLRAVGRARDAADDAWLAQLPAPTTDEEFLRLVEAQARMGTARSVTHLTQLLTTAPGAITRDHATVLVGRYLKPSDASRALLITLTSDAHPETRQLVIAALAAELPVAAALQAAADPWPLVRRAAGTALTERCERARDTTLSAPLMQRVRGESSPDVATVFIDAAARCGGVPPQELAALAQSGPPGARLAAAAALAQLPPAQHENVLTKTFISAHEAAYTDRTAERVAIELTRSLATFPDGRALLLEAFSHEQMADLIVTIIGLVPEADLCADARPQLTTWASTDSGFAQPAKTALARCRRQPPR